MTRKPYGMICPITRACDILEPRWTIPILVGLWAGSTRFNDLRREVGNISPGLLSRRLKELEVMGLVERVTDPATGSVDYIRTEAAVALEPALDALAQWAQCFIEAEFALCTSSVSNLMWKMRNYFVRDELPRRRVVIQFRFSDPGLEYGTYWVLTQPEAAVDICTSTPGWDIDLFVETNRTSLLGILLGRTTVARELANGNLFLSGDPVLARTMHRWIKLGDYAQFENIAMLPDVRSKDRVAAPARRIVAV
ncbi:MAG TPA: winged helix-turn-helix transcriptional regulator [Paracoccaceae bacterium]|nr:winged helix-turn-helix transcriptional regulator [Paracoccaceae bacterium]HMO72219.1 winged helix-turn-helix transcriptional regulator [Paracoccaceae bacterium]